MSKVARFVDELVKKSIDLSVTWMRGDDLAEEGKELRLVRTDW